MDEKKKNSEATNSDTATAGSSEPTAQIQCAVVKLALWDTAEGMRISLETDPIFPADLNECTPAQQMALLMMQTATTAMQAIDAKTSIYTGDEIEELRKKEREGMS